MAEVNKQPDRLPTSHEGEPKHYKDYYEILGVDKNASEDELKKAYRDLAMQYHPDRNPGDKEAIEQYKVVERAYKALSDKESRGIYDAENILDLAEKISGLEDAKELKFISEKVDSATKKSVEEVRDVREEIPDVLRWLDADLDQYLEKKSQITQEEFDEQFQDDWGKKFTEYKGWREKLHNLLLGEYRSRGLIKEEQAQQPQGIEAPEAKGPEISFWGKYEAFLTNFNSLPETEKEKFKKDNSESFKKLYGKSGKLKGNIEKHIKSSNPTKADKVIEELNALVEKAKQGPVGKKVEPGGAATVGKLTTEQARKDNQENEEKVQELIDALKEKISKIESEEYSKKMIEGMGTAAVKTQENVPLARVAPPEASRATEHETIKQKEGRLKDLREKLADTKIPAEQRDSAISSAAFLEREISTLKEKAREQYQKDNAFYQELYPQSDLREDAKQKAVENAKEQGKYYENKQKYEKAFRDKIKIKVENEMMASALAKRWDSLGAKGQEAYGHNFEHFETTFRQKLVDMRRYLDKHDIDMSNEAMFALMDVGYEVENIKKAWFSDDFSIIKNEAQTDKNGNQVWVRKTEKLDKGRFGGWIERMDAYEKGIIDKRVQQIVDEKYEAGRKRFQQHIGAEKKELIKETFDDRIHNTADFSELYAILHQRSPIVCPDGRRYTAKGIIRVLAKGKDGVLKGGKTVEEFREALSQENQLPQSLIIKAAQLLEQQVGSSPASGVKEERPMEIPNARREYLQEQKAAGKLTPEEFNELLQDDFNEVLKSNAPFGGGAIFNLSEQLENIKERTGPLAQEQAKGVSEEEKKYVRKQRIQLRREAVESFKEVLGKQQETLASCRVFLESIIEFNHDIEKPVLMEWADKFSQQYAFSAEQQQTIESIVDEYYARRVKVKELREQYANNDAGLLKELTGMDFTPEEMKDLKVSVGPMSIDIETDNKNTEKIFIRSKDAVPVADEEMAGFMTPTNKENIYLTVVNADFGEQKEALAHEHEHVKNILFRKIFEEAYTGSERKKLLEAYQKEKVDVAEDFLLLPEEKQKKEQKEVKEALHNYLIFERNVGLNKAKDEIFSMIKNNKPGELKHVIRKYLFSGKDKDYDYLKKVRESEDYKYYRELQKGERGKNEDEFFDFVDSKNLLEEQYNDIIENAVTSLLELMKKGKYSKEKAVAFLADKSLVQWPKAVNRQLEAKGIETERKIKKKARQKSKLTGLVL